MVRLIAFALHADEALRFTRGLCVDDEPDLWQKKLGGEIETWIEVGLPEARRLIKAGRRADRVFLYAFGGHAVDVWWQRQGSELTHCANLTVRVINTEASAALSTLVERTMHLACTIEDGQLLLVNERQAVQVGIKTWQEANICFLPCKKFKPQQSPHR